MERVDAVSSVSEMEKVASVSTTEVVVAAEAMAGVSGLGEAAAGGAAMAALSWSGCRVGSVSKQGSSRSEEVGGSNGTGEWAEWVCGVEGGRRACNASSEPRHTAWGWRLVKTGTEIGRSESPPVAWNGGTEWHGMA